MPPNPQRGNSGVFTADTWQTLIIAVTYTVEMGGGEKMEKLCVLNFNASSELSVGNVGYFT